MTLPLPARLAVQTAWLFVAIACADSRSPEASPPPAHCREAELACSTSALGALAGTAARYREVVCDSEVRATAERAGCKSEYAEADRCLRADPPRCTDAGFTGAECIFEYRRLRYCVAVNSQERCAEEFGECGRCVCEACPCDQPCEVGRLERDACVIACEGEPEIDSCIAACDLGRPDLAMVADSCWLSATRVECPSECNAPPAP